MAKKRKSYGATPLIELLLSPGIIFALALSIPLMIFGFGATIKFFQIMFSPATKGSIPVWALFGVGILVLLLLKRQKQNPYIV